LSERPLSLNPLFHHERKVAPDGLKTLHFVPNIPIAERSGAKYQQDIAFIMPEEEKNMNILKEPCILHNFR